MNMETKKEKESKLLPTALPLFMPAAGTCPYGHYHTPSAMNAPHANGCMDTAQKVAFVAQLSLLSLIFHHTSRTQLAWVSEGFDGEKNFSVGSARQPSLTQSKEVDLAAISYVQRAPPSHHPACLGPLCHDSKSVLQVLLREKLSACIECTAEREMSERFDHWNWVGGSPPTVGCTAKLPTTHSCQPT